MKKTFRKSWDAIWHHGSTCSLHLPVCFYLSLGLVWVCEIEIYHIGKNKGNPDVVCEKMSCLIWNQIVTLMVLLKKKISRPHTGNTKSTYTQNYPAYKELTFMKTYFCTSSRFSIKKTNTHFKNVYVFIPCKIYINIYHTTIYRACPI